MVSLDDTRGSDCIEETITGGSFDQKQEDVDTRLDGIGNGDMHVSVDGNIMVSADTSLDVGVGSDEVVEDSDDVGNTGSDYIKLGRSRDWKGNGSGEKLENLNHGFLVGDFVWGKIMNHPWWPGQVYNPSDASEFALKHSQDGHYLVAFFGDGSCSWCLPSQLLPFAKKFKEKNPVDSASRSLLNAVQAAVDEVGRIFESKMTCKCIPLEKRNELARRDVSNSGVKAGAAVPEVDVHRYSVPDYAPAEVLAELIHYAKSVSMDSPLELAVLRSWLSAFYYAKDGRQLPVYHEYDVEGLEDENQTTAAAADDFSVPIEVPILGPKEEDWLAPPAFNNVMTAEPSNDKTYHRRKQKSVADLMRESNKVKPNSQKKNPLKEGKGSRKSASLLKMKMKSIDGEAAEGGSHGVSSRKNGRKRKVGGSENPKVISDDSSNAGNSATAAVDNPKEGSSAGKPNEIVIASTENVSDKAIEESDNASTPRRRKKSKFLSPPYIFPEWRTGISSAKMEPGPDKTSKTDQLGENVHKASENVSASQQDLMAVDVSSDEKLHGDRLNEEKLTFSKYDVSMSVSELLTRVQFAAVDPLFLNKEGTLDVVWLFISALRGSIYVHGENYKLYKKYTRVRKRKSLPSRLGSQQDNISAKSPRLANVRSPKAVKIEGGKPDAPKSEKGPEISREGSNSVRTEALAHCSYLILSFPLGFRLPSKEEIVKLFSKFGSLNVEETIVIVDGHSAQVVYMKDSDAETALKSAVTENLFGVENVIYRLQHSPAGSKIQESYPKPTSSNDSALETHGSSLSDDDLMSDARLISKKVDIMIAILDNYHSKFSTDDKSSVKDDMKNLMESVETVSEKVRVLAETHPKEES